MTLPNEYYRCSNCQEVFLTSKGVCPKCQCPVKINESGGELEPVFNLNE